MYIPGIPMILIPPKVSSSTIFVDENSWVFTAPSSRDVGG